MKKMKKKRRKEDGDDGKEFPCMCLNSFTSMFPVALCAARLLFTSPSGNVMVWTPRACSASDWAGSLPFDPYTSGWR
jgi:hypothetical protein